MIGIALDRAEAWVQAIFIQRGASPAAAASVARALVAAEADGLAGHGLSRLPTYLAMLAAGKIDGAAMPLMQHPKPSVLTIDACNGFAYPAIDLAIAELPAVTRENGMGAAAIRRSSHCGAAGLHVERLAQQGLVALLFANTPEAIAPWGGRRAVFGTNPIAFAAPIEGRPPLVVDLALSKVARGVIVAAKQKGEAIPADWAFDAAGEPTTDPAAALGGTMAALGGAKGAALALIVEVLAAALVGAHFGFEASSFLDDVGPPPGTGQLIFALAPDAFGQSDFGVRMLDLVGAIEGQSVEGHANVRLPGAQRLTRRANARRDGLTISDALIAAYGAPT